MKILFWLVAIPVIALAMTFAVSNHEAVTLDLWPAPLRLDVPLYLVVTGALLLGLVVGLISGWIGTIRARHRARQEAKRAERLNAENEELRHKLNLATHALPGLPAADQSATQAAYPAPTALRRFAGGGFE